LKSYARSEPTKLAKRLEDGEAFLLKSKEVTRSRGGKKKEPVAKRKKTAALPTDLLLRGAIHVASPGKDMRTKFSRKKGGECIEKKHSTRKRGCNHEGIQVQVPAGTRRKHDANSKRRHKSKTSRHNKWKKATSEREYAKGVQKIDRVFNEDASSGQNVENANPSYRLTARGSSLRDGERVGRTVKQSQRTNRGKTKAWGEGSTFQKRRIQWWIPSWGSSPPGDL